MKNILTSSEMKKVDTETIERIGIPGIVLMERAALSVASLIMEMCIRDSLTYLT